MAIKKDYKNSANYYHLRKSKYDVSQSFVHTHWLAIKQAINLLSHHVFGFLVLIFFVSILLAVPLTLVYVSHIVSNIGASINSNAQMSVYLESGLNQSKTQQVIEQIKNYQDIRFVRYISPAQGLKDFEKQSGLSKLTDYLKNNPIPGVVIIRTASNQPAVKTIKSVNTELSKLAGINNIAVDNQWLAKSVKLISSFHKSILIATLIAFFLVFVIITTLFNLLLPESLVNTSKRTMIYLGLLVGVITGVAADFAVSYFSVSIDHIVQQFTFLDLHGLNLMSTTQKLPAIKHHDSNQLGLFSIVINQLLSWIVLISSALIVRRYRIMAYR